MDLAATRKDRGGKPGSKDFSSTFARHARNTPAKPACWVHLRSYTSFLSSRFRWLLPAYKPNGRRRPFLDKAALLRRPSTNRRILRTLPFYWAKVPKILPPELKTPGNSRIIPRSPDCMPHDLLENHVTELQRDRAGHPGKFVVFPDLLVLNCSSMGNQPAGKVISPSADPAIDQIGNETNTRVNYDLPRFPVNLHCQRLLMVKASWEL